MPRLSQWIVRAAFIYLILGFTVGALLLIHKGLPLHPALWAWLPAHIEFLLMGWVVQLTMGVAFWILPRYWEKSRWPPERWVQLAIGCLNLGIWLIVAGGPLGLGRWVTVAGRVAEATAVWLFALHAWQRIVSRDGR